MFLSNFEQLKREFCYWKLLKNAHEGFPNQNFKIYSTELEIFSLKLEIFS